jgi:hypothetical protein
MLEFNFWLELGKAWGLPIVVLAAWYYHNREQNSLWAQMLENNRAQTSEMIKANVEQADQTLSNVNKIWGNVLEMVRQQAERQNEVLKDLLENNQYQGAQLARLEQKIDTNQMCPIVRKEQNK